MISSLCEYELFTKTCVSKNVTVFKLISCNFLPPFMYIITSVVLLTDFDE